MALQALLPDPACLTLESLTLQDTEIVFVVRTARSTVNCPLCAAASKRIHSWYQRTLADLPWQANPVKIKMATRKFFCDNKDCKRRVFTEPIPTVAARYKRKTKRLTEALESLTLLAGGEVAARIAQAFGLTLSPDTLLEAIQKAPAQPIPTPRVLGVDDFAFKRGRRYGTLLVDQERRCPIDLLPERSSASLTEWLKAHPGVEIITRDRSTEFAKGITDGAPQAIQVADRFHLLSNLREALERSVDRNRSQLKGIELPTQGSESVARPRVPYCGSQAERQGKSVRQECRSRQHQEIHALKERGTSILTISRQLGISRSTVYHYLRVEEDGVRHRSHRSSSILDPFVPYLSERFEGGCHNGVQLWQEIKKMGYPGSRKMVAVWIAQQRVPCSEPLSESPAAGSPLKNTSLPTSSSQRTSSSRQFSWFLLRPQESLSPGEQAILAKIEQSCPELSRARALANEFGMLVRQRDEKRLSDWLSSALESGVAEMKSFAAGLLKDESAVRAALSLEWSNGPVEGQVNRLKFVKRSMYGRGGFALLRARVLHRHAA